MNNKITPVWFYPQILQVTINNNKYVTSKISKCHNQNTFKKRCTRDVLDPITGEGQRRPTTPRVVSSPSYFLWLWLSIQLYENSKTSGHQRNHLTLRSSSRKRCRAFRVRFFTRFLSRLITNVRVGFNGVVRAVILKRLFERTILDRKTDQKGSRSRKLVYELEVINIISDNVAQILQTVDRWLRRKRWGTIRRISDSRLAGKLRGSDVSGVSYFCFWLESNY